MLVYEIGSLPPIGEAGRREVVDDVLSTGYVGVALGRDTVLPAHGGGGVAPVGAV